MMSTKELKFFVVIYIFIIVYGFYSNISFCPFYNLTGYPCPGCGMTQGVRYILMGEWDKAFKSHIFSFAIVIVIILSILSFFSKTVNKFLNFMLSTKWIWMSAIILFLFYGIIRVILLQWNQEMYLTFFLYYDYKTVFEFLKDIVEWVQRKLIY